MDSNFYVLEVRNGIILFLNEQTHARDGWHWGTDNESISGPFASSELAVEDARRHSDKPLNLIRWTKDNFLTNKPSASGNLIVVDTGGHVWARSDEEVPKAAKVPSGIKRAFADLAAAGILVLNGKYRRSRNGELQPVYVINPELTEKQIAEKLAELDATK